MPIGERIQAVRKNSSLTLEEFGNKIGIKKSSLSHIENGRTNPSDQTIRSISREFGVREEWLRTGEGDMRTPAPAVDLAQYARDNGISPVEEEIIRAWLAFPADKRREILDHMRSYLSAAQEDTRDWRDKNPSEWTAQDEETAVAEFRQMWRDEKNRRQEAGPVGDASADRLSG